MRCNNPFLDNLRCGRYGADGVRPFYPLATPADNGRSERTPPCVPVQFPPRFLVLSVCPTPNGTPWSRGIRIFCWKGRWLPQIRVLRAFHPHLIQPLFRWQATTQLSLPHDHHGSLLLFGVTALDEKQQELVFDWLSEGQGRVQVVSTTARPLFAFVERGEFRADLCYRLSVLRLVAAPAVPRA